MNECQEDCEEKRWDERCLANPVLFDLVTRLCLFDLPRSHQHATARLTSAHFSFDSPEGHFPPYSQLYLTEAYSFG